MDSPLASQRVGASPTAPNSNSSGVPSQVPRRKRVALRVTAFDRAYAREMLTPILLGVMVIVLVLSANFVYAYMDSVINRGVAFSIVLRLFLLSIPGFAIKGVAVGVILGVCLILSRAVRDNEVTALRAGGASVVRILLPFWFMAILASGTDYILLEYVAPRTNLLAKKTGQKMLHTSATQLIEGDKYFHVGQYYFYVQDVQDKTLRNVMIYERNTGAFSALDAAMFPTVIIAKEAHEDPAKANQWVLTQGVLHAYHENGMLAKQTPFDEMKIDIGQELLQYLEEDRDAFEMTGEELGSRIEALDNAAFDAGKVRQMRVEYHRRYSMPSACFVMALLAAPLSLRFAKHGSFAGLVCAFGLAFVYQALDSFFRAMGIAGRLEPVVAAWSTNAILTLFGLVLLWRER